MGEPKKREHESEIAFQGELTCVKLAARKRCIGQNSLARSTTQLTTTRRPEVGKEVVSHSSAKHVALARAFWWFQLGDFGGKSWYVGGYRCCTVRRRCRSAKGAGRKVVIRGCGCVFG